MPWRQRCRRGLPNHVLGNHDRQRLATRYGPEQARVAAMLLLTLRGTPTLYYGDELGMHDAAIPPDLWRDPLGRDGTRTLNLYRRLLSDRTGSPALRLGSYRSVDLPADDCFASLRECGSERMLVVLNFSSDEWTVDLHHVGTGRIVLSTRPTSFAPTRTSPPPPEGGARAHSPAFLEHGGSHNSPAC